MPTYRRLMETGATGDNGLTQGFPPNTGQGWYTMATGAYPGVHGSTNNTFFDTRQTFTRRRRSRSTATGQPGHRPDERARGAVGGVVGRTGRQEGRPARVDRRAERQHQRPDRRLRELLLPARRAGDPVDPAKQASAAKFGLSYQVAAFTPASGWTNVPAARCRRSRRR